MKAQLLFSDVDGTLLTCAHALHPRVTAALTTARAAGLQVVLATGRSPDALRPYAEALDLADLCICFNGGWTGNVTTGATQHVETLTPASTALAMALVRGRGLEVLLHTAHLSHSDALSPAVQRELEITGEAFALLPPGGALPPETFKILCLLPPAQADHLAADIAARPLPGITALRSGPHLLELVPAHSSKQTAAARLALAAGLGPQDVAAAGDAGNDLTLLGWAGVRLTVANAIPQVKALADFIGPSNDDGGLADALHWLLAPVQPFA